MTHRVQAKQTVHTQLSINYEINTTETYESNFKFLVHVQKQTCKLPSVSWHIVIFTCSLFYVMLKSTTTVWFKLRLRIDQSSPSRYFSSPPGLVSWPAPFCLIAVPLVSLAVHANSGISANLVAYNKNMVWIFIGYSGCECPFSPSLHQGVRTWHTQPRYWMSR